MFNISVLLDVQTNLPETSPFFVCPNGSSEHLFFQVFIVLWMYNFDSRKENSSTRLKIYSTLLATFLTICIFLTWVMILLMIKNKEFKTSTFIISLFLVESEDKSRNKIQHFFHLFDGGIKCSGKVEGRSWPSILILIKCMDRANSSQSNIPSWSTSDNFQILPKTTVYIY